MCTACSSDVCVTTLCPLTPAALPLCLSSLSQTRNAGTVPIQSHHSAASSAPHSATGKANSRTNRTVRTLTAWVRSFFLGNIKNRIILAFYSIFKAYAFPVMSAVCEGYSTVTWPSGSLWLCCGLQKEKLWNMRLIWKRASGQREGEELCKPSKLVLAGEAL